MYLSFGRKLRGLGCVRFGRRVSGSTVGVMLFVYGMFYAFWYCLLAALWLAYGIGYLFFYLPVKGIIKLCNRNNSPQT